MHSLAAPHWLASTGAASSLDSRAGPSRDARVQTPSSSSPQVDLSRVHAQLGINGGGWHQLSVICAVACTSSSTSSPVGGTRQSSLQRRLIDKHEWAVSPLLGQWDSAAQDAWHTWSLQQPAVVVQGTDTSFSPSILLQLAHQGPEGLHRALAAAGTQTAVQLIIGIAQHCQTAAAGAPAATGQACLQPCDELNAYALVCRAVTARVQAEAGAAHAALLPSELASLCWACGVLCNHLLTCRSALEQQQPAPPHARRLRQWQANPVQRLTSFARLAQQMPGPTTSPAASSDSHSQQASNSTTLVPQACHALRCCAVWAASALEPMLAATAQLHGRSYPRQASSSQHRHPAQAVKQTVAPGVEQRMGDASAGSRGDQAAAVAVPACDASCLADMARHLVVLQLRPGRRWWQSYFTASWALLGQPAHGQPGAQQQQQQRYTAQQLSTTLWSLAKLRQHVPPAYLQALLEEAEGQLGSASQQALANSMWSLAKLNVAPYGRLLRSWCGHFRATLNQRSVASAAPAGGPSLPQTGTAKQHRHQPHSAACEQLHISQSLWALASVRCKPCHEWLAGLLADSAATLCHASPQSLSNTMWALGELGHNPAAGWTGSFFAASAQQVAQMPPQGVCNMLQGLLQAHVAVPEAWAQSVMETCTTAVSQGQYNAAQLSSLMWALSQLGHTVDGRLAKAAVHASCFHMRRYAGVCVDMTSTSQAGSTPARYTSGQRAGGAADPAPYRFSSSAQQQGNFAPAVGHMGQKLVSEQQGWADSSSMQGSGMPTSPRVGFAASNVVLLKPGSLRSRARTVTRAALGGGAGLGSRAVSHAIDRRCVFSVATRALGVMARGGTAAGGVATLTLRDLACERGGLPIALRMRLARSLARRRQQARLRGRAAGTLRDLDPLTLARLLHGLAAGLAADATAPLPSPPWRTACALALRIALPIMDARSVALALPAALALGVLPPLCPTRRALHRVVRDAQQHDANHLATLFAALVSDRRLARSTWLLFCCQRLSAFVPHLSCAAVVQLAAALPMLESRRPAIVAEEPSAEDEPSTSRREAGVIGEQPTAHQAELAAAWPASVHTLALVVVPRAALHLSSMGLEDMQALLGGLAGLSTPPAALPVQRQRPGGRVVASTTAAAPQQRTGMDSSGARAVARLGPPPAASQQSGSSRVVAKPGPLSAMLQLQGAGNSSSGPSQQAPRALQPHHGAGTPSVSQQQQQQQQQHALSHMLQVLEPRLTQLAGHQLVHLLISISTQAGPNHVRPSFLAACEAAALVSLTRGCLPGAAKVQLLHALRQMSHMPSPDWVATWHGCTQSQLSRLSPHLLSMALRVSEDAARVGGAAPPSKQWLHHATIGAEQAVKAVSWALEKQVPQAKTGTQPAHPELLSDREVQVLGGSAGDLIAIASRLTVLNATNLTPTLQQLMQRHVCKLRTAVADGRVPVGALLHVLHELRGLQPAACPAWVQAEATHVMQAIVATEPKELFVQIWEHAAASTDVPTSATQVSSDTTVATKAAQTQQQQQQQLPTPPRVAIAAAHRVIELLMALARWGVAPPAPWLKAAVRQAAARIGCFTGPQAAALLRTLALIGPPAEAVEESTVRQLLAGCLHVMRVQCSSAQLAEVGWALSALQTAPTVHWWEAYEEELLGRMRGMPADTLCEIMWAFGSLKRRPCKAWMDGFARAVLPRLDSCSADQLARLVWSLAAVEQVPVAAFAERYLNVSAKALQVPGSFSAQSLALMIGGLVTLGMHPSTEWLSRYTAQLCAVLPNCRAVHLSKVLWSLATLGHRVDDDLLTAAISVAAARVGEMDTGCVAQLTWAVSRLDMTGEQRHLRALVGRLEASRSQATGRQPGGRPAISSRRPRPTPGGDGAARSGVRVGRGGGRLLPSRQQHSAATDVDKDSCPSDEEEEVEEEEEQEEPAQAPVRRLRARPMGRSAPGRRRRSVSPDSDE